MFECVFVLGVIEYDEMLWLCVVCGWGLVCCFEYCVEIVGVDGFI